MRHKPVLLKEILEGLNLKKGAVYIDCNLGDGGHAEAIINSLGGDVTVIGFDLDQDAIARAKANLSGKISENKLHLFRKNFRTLSKTLEEASIPAENYADAILFDLGISSYELDESGRGFSFQKNEPLSMLFGIKDENTFDAADIVNSWKEEDIANVIFAYGEDRFARRIAKAIVESREIDEIRNTKQLADIVRNAYPVVARFGKTNPATKTFQAIRIAVNDELRALKETLPQAVSVLKPGGILAVISFHSLEDRIVKTFFKEISTAAEEGENKSKPLIKIITKRPITPSEEETKKNPRSRSSKLRIAKKL